MSGDRGRGPISPRDLLLREATLCEYLATWVAQLECLLNVMLLNCNTFYVPYSKWGSALASLQHQMEERSQLLCSMAEQGGKDMDVIQNSYWIAYTICSEQCEVKND